MGAKDSRQSSGAGPAWTPPRVARSVVITFLMAGALGAVFPGGPILAFALAGLAAGLASAEYLHGVVSATVGAAIVAVVMLAFPVPDVASGMVLAAVVAAPAAAAFGVALRSRVAERVLVRAVLGVLIVVFLVSALGLADQLAPLFADEMPDESYGFDPVFFIKVFQLQERGVGFYDAYGQAFVSDNRFDQPTADLAGWRTPVTTTLWSLLLGGGDTLAYAFTVLAAAAMAGAWVLASKMADEVSALVAPALLMPYYLAALKDVWFPEFEFWAMFAVIGSAVLLTRKQTGAALGVAVLAGAMREWLISGVIAGGVHLIARKRWRQAIPWIVAGVGVVALYAVNAFLVRRYLLGMGLEPDLGATGRLGGGGPAFVLYTLEFCAGLFAHARVVPYAAFFLGLLGAAASIVRRQYYVPTLLLVPLAAFMVFGSGKVPGDPVGWNDYYNAAFMPVAFVLASVAWRALEPRRRGAATR